MNRLIIIVFIVLFGAEAGAQDVTFTLTNPRTEIEGQDTFYLADVLSYSNNGFKLGSGQLYFNFNTEAFGENVLINGNLEIIIPDSSVLNTLLIAGPFQFNFYNDFVANDNTVSRFSYSWQHAFSLGCLFKDNINYFSDCLFTLKIRFLPGKSDVETELCMESGANYVDQTFTTCGPSDCNINDCFNSPGTQIVNDLYPCSDCRIVYSTADSGDGTLRNALACAQPGDTIRFARNLQLDSILLTSSDLVIDKAIKILANKDYFIVVNGQQVDRVFTIQVGNQVVLEGLHLVQGTNDLNGSIIKNGGNATIRNLTMYMTSSVENGAHILNLGDIQLEGTNALMSP